MSTEEAINDIMRDVRSLRDLSDGEAKSLLSRIQCAIEALPGQERKPDAGPWKASKDGNIIWSDDFQHDVALRVSGDFYSGADRVAYSQALTNTLNGAVPPVAGLPKQPPAGLLHSMAMRMRHDFGLNRDVNQPLSAGMTREEREALLADMARLYEEVAGHGFFKWSEDA